MNGVTHDPEDITRYNGEELGFIPQKGGTELLVIREKNIWAPLVRTLPVSHAAAIGMSELEQRVRWLSVGDSSRWTSRRGGNSTADSWFLSAATRTTAAHSMDGHQPLRFGAGAPTR